MMLYQLLIFASLVSCQQEKKPVQRKERIRIVDAPPKPQITKVLIKSVHFDISTFENVDCNTFEKQFPEASTTLVIDRATLAELSRRIVLFKPTKEKFPLNTRAKVFIYHSNNSCDTLCMSRFRMVLNGTPIQYDKSLSGLLQINID